MDRNIRDIKNMDISPKALVLSNHIPIDMVQAAGLESVYPDIVKGGALGEAYLPRDFCPVIKSSLEQLKGGFCILSSCCDGQRRLHDVINAVGAGTSFLLSFPRNSSERTKVQFAARLKRLWHHLCTLSGHQAQDVTVLENALTGEDKGETAGMERLTDGSGFVDNLPRLMVVGACMFDRASIDNIERLGGRVVALDFTAPHFYPTPEEHLCEGCRDPFMVLAERYMSIPRPQGLERDRRWQHLYKKFVKSQAEGIIYLVPQFCDQSLYEVAWLKKRCQAMGIPMIYIEGEEGSLAGGQSRTRIEAFVEVISFDKGKSDKICGI